MDDATRAQVDAADPKRSTWLAANAGSGKTRVLTDRVARLLLAGVPPQSILCLTFTKAAAAEMQNRLFARLGAWAMAPDAELAQALATVGETGALPAEHLVRARRLFARAIETPGGLKIQTIHAFCAGLLRRFPLEAGVSPQFQEIDEAQNAALMATVADDIVLGPEAANLHAVVAEAGDEAFEGLLQGLMKHRDLFHPPLTATEIWEALDLPPGYNTAALMAEAFDGSEAQILSEATTHLAHGGKQDGNLAAKLAACLPLEPSERRLQQLEGALLTGAKTATPYGSKAGKLGTKAARDAMGPELSEALDGLADRVSEARPHRLVLQSARRSHALHKFAASFLTRMEVEKQARGWLDFDDLILKTRALLNRSAMAQWVLYKLDGGISHILVDEAQDTSPVQWDVITALTEEIIASAAPDDPYPRTLFVVGDRKQSIYSFQGAAPDEFDAMRARYAADLAASGSVLAERQLVYSFRSAPAILASVDQSFQMLATPGAEPEAPHQAFFDALPGRVDLWPPEGRERTELEDRAWDDPLDRVADSDPSAVLAKKIAEEIAGWIARGDTLPLPDGTRRPITAEDVLILVQRRGPLFHQIIRACKAEGLPIAGADRLYLGEALAVKDLIALLAFLETPEDDLSLAAVLRSPLFGWSEDDLFRLAHRREGYLWEALRIREDRSDTLEMLRDLRGQTDYLRPFDLLERILSRHGGRQRLVARLGPESEEAIDALLSLALEYESKAIPSLTGFLSWFAAEEIEIKREAESSGGQLRVMTVHGAKGLEEQIVILPDCAKRVLRNRDMLLKAEPNWMAWKPSVGDMPPVLAEAAAQWAERQRQERDRLLYVAMTRARCWLIACAAGDTGSDPGDSWHATIGAGLTALQAETIQTPTGAGLRYGTGDWTGGVLQTDRQNALDQEMVLPDWTKTRAPRPEPTPRPRAPSDLGGAKALPGEAGLDPEAALRRGRQLHLLLEHLPSLPEASWRTLAPGILALDEDPALGAEAMPVIDEAIRVLTAPHLSSLFTADSLAEVEITAELPELGGRIQGAIDRLLITPDRVQAIDFKSNVIVPVRADQVPLGLLRQLGAYAAALAQIYPDKEVETAILWTATGNLMTLPHDLVMEALCTADLPQMQS
ncbi:MAG: double-strand break repair helicase AddA [Pseudomonadota bacterium]